MQSYTKHAGLDWFDKKNHTHMKKIIYLWGENIILNKERQFSNNNIPLGMYTEWFKHAIFSTYFLKESYFSIMSDVRSHF